MSTNGWSGVENMHIVFGIRNAMSTCIRHDFGNKGPHYYQRRCPMASLYALISHECRLSDHFACEFG